LPPNRADRIEERWVPPLHVLRREAERVRASTAGLEPDTRSLYDLIRDAASVSTDPEAVAREMVGALGAVAGEDGLRELQEALNKSEDKESDA
jgi:hypothetical protein